MPRGKTTSNRGKTPSMRGVNVGAGPSTRTTTRTGRLHLEDFETPANVRDPENGVSFDEEVENFIDENIEDPVERARRGLEIIGRSPGNSQQNSIRENNPPVPPPQPERTVTSPMTHAEVDALIAERLDAQTRLLSEQFAYMMHNSLADFRRSLKAAADPPKTAQFAASSGPDQDSYENLFSEPPPRNNPNTVPDPSQNYASSLNRHNFIRKEEFSEIKFDGKTMSVRQFIFKLKTLKEANEVSWDYIVKNFYRCVKDHADTWYWSLVQKLDSAGLKLSWNILKDALERDFGGRQVDADISNMMWSRRQKYNESFDDFCNDIISMNNRMTNRKDDSELINIFKRNCSNRLISGIYNYSCASVEQFKIHGVKYESEVENRFKGSSKVSELEDIQYLPSTSKMSFAGPENPTEVEEIKQPRERPKIQCNKCHEPVIFCFKCFTPNVTFPYCQTCHPENSKGSGSRQNPNSHST